MNKTILSTSTKYIFYTQSIIFLVWKIPSKLMKSTLPTPLFIIINIDKKTNIIYIYNMSPYQ